MPHVVAPTIESKWVALGIEYAAPVGQPENASPGLLRGGDGADCLEELGSDGSWS